MPAALPLLGTRWRAREGSQSSGRPDWRAPTLFACANASATASERVCACMGVLNHVGERSSLFIASLRAAAIWPACASASATAPSVLTRSEGSLNRAGKLAGLFPRLQLVPVPLPSAPNALGAEIQASLIKASNRGSFVARAAALLLFGQLKASACITVWRALARPERIVNRAGKLAGLFRGSSLLPAPVSLLGELCALPAVFNRTGKLAGALLQAPACASFSITILKRVGALGGVLN